MYTVVEIANGVRPVGSPGTLLLLKMLFQFHFTIFHLKKTTLYRGFLFLCGENNPQNSCNRFNEGFGDTFPFFVYKQTTGWCLCMESYSLWCQPYHGADIPSSPGPMHSRQYIPHLSGSPWR